MVLSAAQKSMQSNKSKNTKLELDVRKYLRSAGLSGYRLHWKAPGKPDIAYPGKKIAIFVNGCFWHDCPTCKPKRPKKNADFWNTKLDANKARDMKNYALLRDSGWTVIVIWECELRKDHFSQTMEQIADKIRGI